MASFAYQPPDDDPRELRDSVLQFSAAPDRSCEQVEEAITDLAAYRLWAEVRRRQNPSSPLAARYVDELNELLAILRNAYQPRDGH